MNPFFFIICQIPKMINVSMIYSSVTDKLEVFSWTSPQLSRYLSCLLTFDHPNSGSAVFALSYNENATILNCKR